MNTPTWDPIQAAEALIDGEWGAVTEANEPVVNALHALCVATIAVAEEQRTANLIAYAHAIDDTDLQVIDVIQMRLGLTS